MKHPDSQKMERSCKSCLDKHRASSLLAPEGDDEADSASNGSKYGVVWRPDEEADQCSACWAPFTTSNRRHHCRFCGDIFCGKCSSQELLHPKTNTAERACDPCVSRLQVARAMGMERKSPQFLLRAAEMGLSALAMILAFAGSSPFAGLIAIVTLIVSGLNLYIRYNLVTKGITFDEFMEKICEGMDPDQLNICRLIGDGLSCLLGVIAGIVAMAGANGGAAIVAGLMLLAVGGCLGASSWFSYIEASSAIQAVMSGNDSERAGRTKVSTDDEECPDGEERLGKVDFGHSRTH